MGGKGGASPGNSQMVQFEMQQAAEARAKEEARQARLKSGGERIDKLWLGDPVKKMQNVTFHQADLKDFTPTSTAGSGGKASVVPGATGGELLDIGDTGIKYRPISLAGNTGYEFWTPDGNTPAGVFTDFNEGLKGWEGLNYNTEKVVPGEYTNQPFDQAFYDKYKNAFTGYDPVKSTADNPVYKGGQGEEIQRQYSAADRKAQYDYARAGTLGSSQATAGRADLLSQEQNEMAKMGVRADQAVGALKKSFEEQRQQAYNQLYLTEDPDKAANTAISAVANAKLSTPEQPSLGDLFKPLIIGTGGAIGGFQDQSAFNRGYTAKPANWGGSGSTSQG